MKFKKKIDLNNANRLRNKSFESGERTTSEALFIAKFKRYYELGVEYMSEGDLILDAGCGAGFGANLITNITGCRVIGLDDSEDVIKYNAKVFKDLEIYKCDLTDTSMYPRSMFHDTINTITAFNLLNNFPEPVIVMGNLAKFNAEYIIGTVQIERESIWHYNDINKKELKRIALAAGYDVEKTEVFIDEPNIMFFVLKKTKELEKKILFDRSKTNHFVPVNKRKVPEFIGPVEEFPRKILILGSGMSAMDIKNIDTRGWYVLAINNAWKLGKWDSLIYPSDFFNLPDEQQSKGKTLLPFSKYTVNCGKYGLEKNRGCSMIFNAAYYALSMKPETIAFLGTDLYYPPNVDTHFYGKGGLDPLRLGVENLKLFLERFNNIAKDNKVRLYNLSREENTLLPFERFVKVQDKKAVFLTFDKGFIPYAEAFVSSFLRNGNNDYDVVCFTVGINNDLRLLGYPWNESNVKIINHNIKFESVQAKRCYLNSKRFELYKEELPNYNFVYMTDADTICDGKLDKILDEMLCDDLGMIFHDSRDYRRKVRACSIGVNVNEYSLKFFDEYLLNLEQIYGNNEWYNDQIALGKTINENKHGYRIKKLNQKRYCAFYQTDNGVMVATCTENKLKGNYYTNLYYQEQKLIEEKRNV